MTRTILAAALAAVALCGCAARYWSGVERPGDLPVTAADSPDHDFRVTVRNTVGIGFDGDRPEDRLRVVTIALQAECRRVELVGEQPIKLGTYGTGRPMIDYVSKVRCIRA